MSKQMKLFENEHPLETPELIGTDAEKIAGIKFWADLIGLVRSIDSTFISYENKLAIIKFLKKELDLVDVEITNVSSTVVSQPGVIPSAEQLPASEDPPETNVVDLTKSAEVAATVPTAVSNITPAANPVTKQAPPLPKKAPTFENLEKLRRVAGAGKWGISHADKKK